ncbi:MAG: glycoside hydrolase family 25 protein [Gammaproteobacteria bacterium]
MIRGFDGSMFQNVIDWAAVKASGLAQFAYARASYGADYVDPDFARNHDVARERSIPIGSYHFWLYDQSPQSQVAKFLALTKEAGRLGTLLPMIDVEEGSFTIVPSVGRAIEALRAVIDPIKAAAGPKPIILYTNYDTWQRFFANTSAFNDCLLWLAQTENPADGLYGGWPKYAIWQDGTTTIPGITGAVDYDTLAPGLTLADIAR